MSQAGIVVQSRWRRESATRMLPREVMADVTFANDAGMKKWQDSVIYHYFKHLCRLLEKCGHSLVPSLIEHIDPDDDFFLVWLQDRREAFQFPASVYISQMSDIEVHNHFLAFCVCHAYGYSNFRFVLLESLHVDQSRWTKYSEGNWIGPSHVMSENTWWGRDYPVYKYCFVVKTDKDQEIKRFQLLTRKSKCVKEWNVKDEWDSADYWCGFLHSKCFDKSHCLASPDRQVVSLRNAVIKKIVDDKVDTAPLPTLLKKEIEKFQRKWCGAVQLE